MPTCCKFTLISFSLLLSEFADFGQYFPLLSIFNVSASYSNSDKSIVAFPIQSSSFLLVISWIIAGAIVLESITSLDCNWMFLRYALINRLLGFPIHLE